MLSAVPTWRPCWVVVWKNISVILYVIVRLWFASKRVYDRGRKWEARQNDSAGSVWHRVTDPSARPIYRSHMCRVCGVKPSYGGNKRRTTCNCSGWIELCSLCPRGLAYRNLRNRNPISCYSAECPEICIRYCMYSVQFKCIRSARRLHLLRAGSNQRERTWNLSTEGTSFGLGLVLVEAGR